MQTTFIIVLAASSFLLSLPSRAQQAAVPAPQEPGRAVARPASGQKSLPESVSVKPEIRAKLAETRISLTLNGESSDSALQSLLDATKLSYEFDPAFYRTAVTLSTGQGGGFGGGGFGGGLGGGRSGAALDLPPRSITMKLLNASIPKAMDSLTQAIGVGWTAVEEDGNITIRIVKLRTTQTAYDTALTLYGAAQGGNQVAGGLGTTVNTGSYSAFFYSRAVPDVRVKLDAKNWSVRDALKQILQNAKVEFAIDEDVSNDLKRNIGFENITLMTALDVICQSSDIGWRSEGTPKGTLVRISKRYAAPADTVKGTDPVN